MEALVAIFILTMLALSLGQVVGLSMLNNQAAEDLTQATALASAKIEQLRSQNYDALTAGGDLDSDVDGYYDTPDADGDGVVDFTRRWEVIDRPGGKLIQVRSFSILEAVGQSKVATMATLMADPDDGASAP